MDMDDNDFMGEIEFDLSPAQQKIVSRAITMASAGEDDDDPFIKTALDDEASRAEAVPWLHSCIGANRNADM